MTLVLPNRTPAVRANARQILEALHQCRQQPQRRLLSARPLRDRHGYSSSIHTHHAKHLQRRSSNFKSRAFSIWPFPSSGTSAPPPPSQMSPPNDVAHSQSTIQESVATSATQPDMPTAAASPDATPATTPAADQSLDALASSVHTPTLSEYGLGDTWYVGTFQKIFVAVHDLTGLPWWLTISVTIVGIRLAIFPIFGRILARQGRFMQHQDEFKEITVQFQYAQKRKDNALLHQAQAAKAAFSKKYETGPLAPLALPMIQGPIFIGVFLALKRMANAQWPDFLHGGTLWFENLTLPDPYYILPAASVACTFAVLQMGSDTGIGAAERTPQQKAMLRILRVVLLLAFPLIIHFPAAVLSYWVTTNMFSLVQAYVLKQKAVRNYFNIPERTRPGPAMDLVSEVDPNKSMGFVESFKSTSGIGLDRTASKESTAVPQVQSSGSQSQLGSVLGAQMSTAAKPKQERGLSDYLGSNNVAETKTVVFRPQNVGTNAATERPSSQSRRTQRVSSKTTAYKKR